MPENLAASFTAAGKLMSPHRIRNAKISPPTAHPQQRQLCWLGYTTNERPDLEWCHGQQPTKTCPDRRSSIRSAMTSSSRVARRTDSIIPLGIVRCVPVRGGKCQLKLSEEFAMVCIVVLS